MDVSRGDRTFEPGDRVRRMRKNAEGVDVGPDPRERYNDTQVVVLRMTASGESGWEAWPTAETEPVPPDVVTLTLSYRGREVTEEVSVDAWRDVAGRVQSVHPIGTPLIDACRALAEKVDGGES